jgi:tetratricopeptide (TPR) repeat protein
VRLKELATASLILAGILILACDRDEARQQPNVSLQAGTLLEVPHPSLEGTESGVQDQIRQYQAKLEELTEPERGQPETLAQAFADLGLAYVLYDFPEAAEVCFENSRRLMPQDHRWHYLVGYVHYLLGRLSDAIPLFERSLELQPDFLPAVLRMGRAHLELGDHEVARPWFDRALQLDPSAAAGLEGLGKIAAASGDPEKALEYFSRALAEEPTATSLHYALGQTYRDLGRMDEARRELEKSGDAAVPIRDPLISPLAVIGQSVQLYIIQGGEALENEDYELAAAAYERALEKDPTRFVAYKGRAHALERLGDLEGAIRDLELGLERGTTGRQGTDDKERAELHGMLGGLEVLRKRDEAAARHFEESLRLRQNQPSVRMSLANAQARLGRFQAALTHYTTLLETDPDQATDILVKRAAVLINLGRGSEALENLERAVTLKPEDGPLRLHYAEALEHLGRPQQAAEQRIRATSATGDSERVRVLLEMADRELRAGSLEEALRLISEAVDEEPGRHDLLYRRGTVLGHLGRCEQGLPDFRLVVEKMPRHSAARQSEIICLILAERYGEARFRLNEALRIFSLDARLAHIQARLLATSPDPRVRDGALALEVARRLVDNVGGLRVRETLALAHAESGDLEQAIELQRGLVAEADSEGNEVLVQDLETKLEQLERGDPWYAASPKEILDAAFGKS